MSQKHMPRPVELKLCPRDRWFRNHFLYYEMVKVKVQLVSASWTAYMEVSV